MSDDEIVAGPPGARIEDLETPDLRPRYKSWRKKYRKMKARFDEVMKDNSAMFKDEQRMDSITKRLQEQNEFVTCLSIMSLSTSTDQTYSQLLDLLLELNSSVQLPTAYRFDVSHPSIPPHDYDSIDLDNANRLLFDAHNATARNELHVSEFQHIRRSLETTLAKQASTTSLRALEQSVPHPDFDPAHDASPSHLTETGPYSSFFDSAHEEAYLSRLDTKLNDTADAAKVSRPSSPGAGLSFAAMTAREIEREVELRNPSSVHNWLKRHNVSIQTNAEVDADLGPSSGKTKSRPLARKVGDRAVGRARDKGDDGDGSPMPSVGRDSADVFADTIEHGDETPGGTKKKARDADETYRPKGGKGSKAKRKREDGEGAGSGSGGKIKKIRVSAAGSGARLTPGPGGSAAVASDAEGDTMRSDAAGT